MTNTFDFYAITVSSTRKRDLLKAGANPEYIKTRTHYENVGARSYPRRTYTATLAFVDAGPTARTQVDAEIAKAKALGLTATAIYHARD